MRAQNIHELTVMSPIKREKKYEIVITLQVIPKKLLPGCFSRHTL